MVELDIKMESRIVKAVIRKFKITHRLPRKVKKDLKKVFGPNAYKAWFESKKVSFTNMPIYFDSGTVNAEVNQDLLDELSEFDQIDMETELSMFLGNELL